MADTPQLLILDGPFAGKRITLGSEIVVGRGSEATVCMPDGAMSRRHARFRVRRKKVLVGDLGSNNGVLHNGRLVRKAKLAIGDRVRLGDTSFEVVQPAEPVEQGRSSGSTPAAPGLARTMVDRVRTLADFEPRSLGAMPTDQFLAAMGVPSERELSATGLGVDRSGLRTMVRNFATVYNVSRILERCLTERDLLEAIGELIFKAVEADQVNVMLMDPDTQTMRNRLSRTRHSDKRGEPIGLGQDALKTVVDDKHTVVMQHQPHDNGTNGDGEGGHPLMAVPVLHGDDVTGVVTVARRAGDAFQRQDVELITVIASLLGLRVQNVRLVEEQAARIRELSELQQELVARERMAVLGRLASGLSHEIRNLLTPLMLSTSLLNEEADATGNDQLAETAQWLVEVQRGVLTLLEEVRLQARGDQAELTLATHELGPTVERIVAFSRLDGDVQRHRVEVDVDGVPPFAFDKGRLQQVLLNLIRNAAQAMEDQGTIAIRCRAVVDRKRWVELTVSDDGRGMSEEQQARIFEPFFTTKTNGMGLGLQISRTIVERHGGMLSCRSRQGHGTAMIVRLPLSV